MSIAMLSRAGMPAEAAQWWLAVLARLLRTGNPAATIDRLFGSQHVRDLRLIAAVAQAGMLLVFVFGFMLSFEGALADHWSGLATSLWHLPLAIFEGFGKFLTVFGPALAVYGGVLAWVYQTGSARLGVVDLFACEISTLCKVMTVTGAARRYIDSFEHAPPAPAEAPANGRQFASQENYFPVFEGNSRDLQSLEARVVINITAFYTYMKAVRDSLRSLASIGAQAEEERREAARNVIYMLFLGLESARLAVTDLVEFEPEEAERRIVILLSELEAFAFLCGQYPPDDMHSKRIMLRRPEYEALVPALIGTVKAGWQRENDAAAGRLSQWEPAWRLLDELWNRYTDAVMAADRPVLAAA